MSSDFSSETGTAILLIAHGSRLIAANADLFQLADLLRARFPGQTVEVAFLELAEPTIPQAAKRCVADGAKKVLMLPYFLSAGTHVTDDLQRFQAQFAQDWPTVRFELCPPLGLHPLMVDIVCDRLAQSSSVRAD